MPVELSEPFLEAQLQDPSPAAVNALIHCPGDLIVLGAGGKMGPSLVRMAHAAARHADGRHPRRVIAVSRFSSLQAQRSLEDAGAEVVRCDLLDPTAVAALPDAPNVIFMAGQKFGTRDAPDRTWMMNVVVPSIVARRYVTSRIVVFSTGNVYPLTPARAGGAREADPPAPVGEYAWSCLGRERVFEHAATAGARVAIMRLNYAIALRYGVLTDLARQVWAGHPISLAMGHVNVIWQGDANSAALELLPLADAPPFILNVTGPTTLAVRELAEELGRRLGRPPVFVGTEAADALLSNTARMAQHLAPPRVALETMLDWTAQWVRRGLPLLDRPTHFDVRDGGF